MPKNSGAQEAQECTTAWNAAPVKAPQKSCLSSQAFLLVGWLMGLCICCPDRLMKGSYCYCWCFHWTCHQLAWKLQSVLLNSKQKTPSLAGRLSSRLSPRWKKQISSGDLATLNFLDYKGMGDERATLWNVECGSVAITWSWRKDGKRFFLLEG